VAQTMMRGVFCLFAEEPASLPGSLLTKLVDHNRKDRAELTDRATELRKGLDLRVLARVLYEPPLTAPGND